MAINEYSIGDAVTLRSDDRALGRIDQYELLRELGGGGFGTVYLALDTVAGVEVAVKGLPPIVRNNAEELQRIRANFALVSRLHHPYIATALVLHPVKDVTYCDLSVRQKLRVDTGDTLMVMEYAPGVTLSKWRRQFPGGKVPLEPALQIVWQIAQALDYAHEQNIVHRDIKPSNVMVETKPDGEVTARLLDFGLAAEVRSSMGRVSREIHDTSGTRPYMAPEQWAGRKQGPATDQYSLAVLLCELLTGEVPFASVFDTGDPVVMMTAVCNREVELPADCPRQVALRRALAKEPSQRFASCMEFVETAAKSEPVQGPTPQPTAEPKVGGLTKWKGLFLGIGVLLIILSLSSGVWYYHKKNAGQDSLSLDGSSLAERMMSAKKKLSADEVLIGNVLAQLLSCISMQTVPGKDGSSPFDLDPKTGEVFFNVLVHLDNEKYDRFAKQVVDNLEPIATRKETRKGEYRGDGFLSFENDNYQRGSLVVVGRNLRIPTATVLCFEKNHEDLLRKYIAVGDLAVGIFLKNQQGEIVAEGAKRCGDAHDYDCSVISSDYGGYYIIAPSFLFSPRYVLTTVKYKDTPITERPLRISLGKFTPEELKNVGMLNIKMTLGFLKNEKFIEQL